MWNPTNQIIHICNHQCVYKSGIQSKYLLIRTPYLQLFLNPFTCHVDGWSITQRSNVYILVWIILLLDGMRVVISWSSWCPRCVHSKQAPIKIWQDWSLFVSGWVVGLGIPNSLFFYFKITKYRSICDRPSHLDGVLHKSGSAQFLPRSWYGIFHDSDWVLRQVRVSFDGWCGTL